ncbi:hypothetical protein PRIPAC_91942 [Pristionchus pacificus]|uniref:Uncharacterized protein n=1 Tax=Pristionchus pacificus TaxID=54126 RepID=A0A2A6BQR1_PRIPA|nr:hypothetical protein PRIPAC_91942 [Pristionchus pacificus]|eukprot:PDM68123.1 hypothetical protein PRIPAC_46167 [Pristionchus pacificus]
MINLDILVASRLESNGEYDEHKLGTVKEEMNKTTQSYGIVHPEKIYLHEEGLRWTFVEGEHECSECSKNLKWKKEAQQGFRTLLNCNTCGLTKISKERTNQFPLRFPRQ